MTIHIISEHFGSPRWIPLQARQFERHVRGDYRTYTCLEGVADPSYSRYFTRVVAAQGPHAGKLNHLAEVVIEESSRDDDVVVFLDGDAFPIASLSDKLDGWLSESPLVAVRRDENLGDPQPHPCVCVTTVGFWRDLRGDWSEGHAWPARDGTLRTDVGANLLYSLNVAGVSWKPLLRTNHHDLHPVFFGVYDHIVYHHGSGFRRGLSREVMAQAPGATKPGGGAIVRRSRRLRQRRWFRKRRAEMDELSEQVFARLNIDCESLDWLGEHGEA